MGYGHLTSEYFAFLFYPVTYKSSLKIRNGDFDFGV